MHKRGTSNANSRGSSSDRRARKIYLLATFGDGYSAPCHFCGFHLDWFTITADRIIRAIDGGTYRRGNIRPACGSCNSSDGSLEMWARKRKSLATKQEVAA